MSKKTDQIIDNDVIQITDLNNDNNNYDYGIINRINTDPNNLSNIRGNYYDYNVDNYVDNYADNYADNYVNNYADNYANNYADNSNDIDHTINVVEEGNLFGGAKKKKTNSNTKSI